MIHIQLKENDASFQWGKKNHASKTPLYRMRAHCLEVKVSGSSVFSVWVTKCCWWLCWGGQFCLIVYQDMKWITKALPDADIAHCCVAITANEQLQEPRIWLNFLCIGLTVCSNSMQWRGVYQQSRRVKELSHSATTKPASQQHFSSCQLYFNLFTGVNIRKR